MNKSFLKNIILTALCLALLAVLYPIYLEIHKEEILKEDLLAALLEGEKEPLYFNERTQESDCKAQGLLPDKDCTPGAIFPNATKDEVCVSGYSATVRNVPPSLKKKVFAEYNIKYPLPFGSYEIDHLIPLALGGSNDIANLWPKSAEPFPGFYEKNITGNYLHEEVCKGNIVLSVAQERIATDWFLIYNNISEKEIKELKLKYRNWADR
ncbi:MAG: HNH endonuclease signature motif containing protein [Patescibacteria group bacterium]